MGVVLRLDHIAITVSDLKQSLPFYIDLLGFEEVGRHRLEGETISTMVGKPGLIMDVVRLRTPDKSNILLDLQEYVTPRGAASNARLGMSNHSHVAFRVTNLPGIYSRLKERGAQFVSAPVTFDVEDGKVQVVFLKDPDGAIVELVEQPTGSQEAEH